MITKPNTIRPWTSHVCGIAAGAAVLFGTLPAAAGTRTCVQDAYNFLNGTPAAGEIARGVRVSVAGMWPGGGGSSYAPWTYFGKVESSTGYNASYGGALLSSSSFPLWYDKSYSYSYFDQGSSNFSFQAIPIDDTYPVRLYGGALSAIDAQCVRAYSGADYVLYGFDGYGYVWIISLAKWQTFVN